MDALQALLELGHRLILVNKKDASHIFVQQNLISKEP